MGLISQNRRDIMERIAAAAARAGRAPGEVTLVAVSKTHPADRIAELAAAGQACFGENRVREAIDKQAELAADWPGLQWHLIGHLQRNKVNAAVGRFSLIHSVDSVRLIEAMQARAAALAVTQPILLEINLAGEASKSGAAEGEVETLLAALAIAPNLRGLGWMIIPPQSDEAEAARPYFRRLRELAERVGERENFTPRHLSMGMSDDFEIAVEEGATLVRVGTALFGARESPTE